MGQLSTTLTRISSNYGQIQTCEYNMHLIKPTYCIMKYMASSDSIVAAKDSRTVLAIPVRSKSIAALVYELSGLILKSLSARLRNPS